MSKSLSDLTAQCIRCGFCLEACPTFVETGNEAMSPRGRIYLVRSVEEGKLQWDEGARQKIDSCLGCRACETACPSGVEYGKILELARERIESEHPKTAQKMMLGGLTRPGLARLQITLSRLLPGKTLPAPLARMLTHEAPEAWKPTPQKPSGWPPLDESKLPPITQDVHLLEGCVMRVLFPRVHEATRRLLRRVGCRVVPGADGCCGALHAHSGLLGQAEANAQAMAKTLRPDIPLIINSAGCGSTIKEYGSIVGKGLEATARNALDASEFLDRMGLAEKLALAPGLSGSATYHDACHLAHGQKVTAAPRRLLAAVPGLELRPLAESDMCCGSAGIYNLVQPTMARRLLDRKWANVEATGADFVVSGNPGCHAWLAQAAAMAGHSRRVFHTMELLEAAFSGLPPEHGV